MYCFTHILNYMVCYKISKALSTYSKAVKSEILTISKAKVHHAISLAYWNQLNTPAALKHAEEAVQMRHSTSPEGEELAESHFLKGMLTSTHLIEL